MKSLIRGTVPQPEDQRFQVYNYLHLKKWELTESYLIRAGFCAVGSNKCIEGGRVPINGTIYNHLVGLVWATSTDSRYLVGLADAVGGPVCHSGE